MEPWLLISFSIFITVLLKFTLFSSKPSTKLTGSRLPGPTTIPLLGHFIWLFKLASGIEPVLLDLHDKYGPVVSLPVPFASQPSIFISDRLLAHQALVQSGAVFADRPPAQPTIQLISSNQRIIASATYGPTWRLLRRNLISETLNPSRVKSFASSRKWVMDILASRLGNEVKAEKRRAVEVLEHLRVSMTCLFLYMCFGEKVEEAKIEEIVEVQRRFLLGLIGEFQTLNMGPTWLTKILFAKRWDEFFKIQRQQTEVLLPMIRARKKVKQERETLVSKNKKQDDDDDNTNDNFVVAYVDTLMDLEVPDEKRKFNEGELVNQCSELLNSGTDTMAVTLQWVIANIVKYPQIQEKLVAEMKGVVGVREEDVKEEDLQKLPYLKAVVLEGLRRHPPGHFLVPHSVSEDIILGGYVVPKNSNVNFLVAEMGWDPKVWEDPMEFRPERFLVGEKNVSVCDITGSKEIKMMPFGAGRRICPGWSLGLLLLEYFVANLVWKFEWRGVEGVGVDLSEKQESSWVMKNPLQAHISPRFKK